MSQYEHMEPAVEAICNSLETEPHLWEIGMFTFNKKGTDIFYWKGPTTAPIVSIWSGGNHEQVFSNKQGVRIEQSLRKAMQDVASKSQRKILDIFK